jgi:mono/diheme cytochrome c family protein
MGARQRLAAILRDADLRTGQFASATNWPDMVPRITFAIVLASTAVIAEDFPPERIRAGAAIFSRNCSPCHGTRMQNPESAFDLREFPPDQHERFVSSVTRGQNQMPPWGDLLKPEEIEALWAYVMAGEPR